MRKLSWIAILALLFLSALPSNAQCGLYTYQDFWIDENSDGVGDDYAQATCYQSSAYAEVHVRMPSGYQNAASAAGSTVAEAVADSPSADAAGDGLVWGVSQASSACWEYPTLLPFNFDVSVAIAETRVKWLGDKFSGLCVVTNWCGNTSTPMCSYTGVYVGTNGTCLPAWDVESLAWKINNGPRHCLINVAVPRLDAPLSDRCTPEN